MRHLHHHRVEVSLAYSDVRAGSDLPELVRAVEARGGRTVNLRVGRWPEPGDVGAARRLHRLVEQVQPDVVHAHSSKAGLLARLPLVVPRSTPSFYTPHAYYGMGERGGIATRISNGLERLLAHRSTTIDVSEDEARFGRERLGVSPERQLVILNSVQLDRFRPASAAEKAEARQSLDLPPEALVIGSVGRLSYQKDPQTLLRAVAPVVRCRPDVLVVHLGSGELAPEVADLTRTLGIDGQVRMLGYLDDPVALYRSLDAFALTPRYEANWPTAIIEALACDLPIVAATGPGTSDLASAGLSHCWTAPTGDVPGLEAAFTALVDDLAAGRSSNHRAYAEQHFDPEVTFGQVLAAYEAAVRP